MRNQLPMNFIGLNLLLSKADEEKSKVEYNKAALLYKSADKAYIDLFKAPCHRARKEIFEIAQRGNPSALRILAEFYYNGIHVKEDQNFANNLLFISNHPSSEESKELFNKLLLHPGIQEKFDILVGDKLDTSIEKHYYNNEKPNPSSWQTQILGYIPSPETLLIAGFLALAGYRYFSSGRNR